MIHTEHPAMSVSILGGFKTLLIVGVGIFAFFQIDPLSDKPASDVSVTAYSYPFSVPKAMMEGYVGQNAQILQARSVWEFKIKNDGSKDLTGIVLDFPFSGSYNILLPGRLQDDAIPSFTRQITIDNLGSGQEARLMIWVGDDLSPDLERKIRVQSNSGILPVDYPVRPSGLIAWVEKYKTPLSAGLFVLFLVTVL